MIADRFELLECVGAGAMGEVWSAKHLALDKQVAVKVLGVSGQTDPLVVGRFRSEARAASRLDHPNSVRIEDFGEAEGGLLFIVMEFLRGQDLGALMKRTGRLSEQRAMAILRQVLSALAAAHQVGIVHRDLKPANIMLIKGPEGGELVKVCDFGIAKLQDPLGSEDPTGMMTLTRAGAVVGTPSYMSPEQAGGKRVDARSDLFSCGVLLYHMLTGEKPFRAETLMGLLTQVMSEQPRPISQLVSTVDQRLVAIADRALCKQPNDRFQSAREMREALDAVLEHPHDRTVALAGAAPVDRTRALSSSQLPGAPTPQPAAAMHSLGGQTLAPAVQTGTWARSGTYDGRITPVAPPEPKSKLWMVGVALALAIGGFVYFNAQRPRVGEMERVLSLGSWGAAEDYALEHFETFRDDPQAKAVVQDAMRQRRAAMNIVKEVGIAFDPTFVPSASTWTGIASWPGRPERHAFTLRITEVGDGTLSGTLDWPDDGIRAAIVGYNDGNHLVMWEPELITGQGLRNVEYNLYDKKSLLVGAGILKGYDGSTRAVWDAKAAP